MALKAVSLVELKLDVLLEPGLTGESVSEVCRRHGISRASFYRYRSRYLAGGVEALEELSRRPHGSPLRIDPGLERAVCEMRTRHPRWGARRIRAELARVGVDPPATSTVHEALRRNYLVAPHPPRRRRARIRFEREISNDLWQIDATRVLLADESPAWVVDLLDDHARYLVGASAVEEVTAEAAWSVFARAAALHGLPRQLLSDNGLCFTGRRHGVEVLFEQRLAKTGVQMINSAPSHPETLGKLERFHRTLKEWLHDEGPARTLDGLQELLDRFREHYNLERPHQGIADLTPAERYRLGFEIVNGSQPPISHEHPAATQADLDKPPSYPSYSILRKVSTVGELSYKGLSIQVGSRWNGATLRVVEVGELIHVYHGLELVRALAPDRTKRTQSLGRRPGARRPRLRTRQPAGLTAGTGRSPDLDRTPKT